MSVTTRTNLCTNPRVQGTTGWDYRWNGSAGMAATNSQSNTGGYAGGYLRKTVTTGGSAQDSGFNTHDTTVPATPGTTYTASAYMETNHAGGVSVQAVLIFEDASHNPIGTPSQGSNVTAAASWTQIAVTATAPANTAYLYAIFGNYNTPVTWAVGDTFDMSAALVEQSAAVGTYFDGTFVSAAGVVYAWTGTANASTSTATTYAPYITLSQGSSPGPNVTVTYQDFDPGTNVINIWRTVDGRRRPVRGRRRRNVVGSDFVVDYEVALGRTVAYDVEILSGVCAGVTVTTATITVAATYGWLSDPLSPSTAIPVYGDVGPNGEPGLDFDALSKYEYKSAITEMTVAGTDEPVALVGQRQAADQVDVNVTTLATTQTNALRVLVKQAGILLFRPLPGWGSAPPGLCYIAAKSVIELPINEKMGGQMVAWQLKSDLVAPPAAPVAVPTTTYGTVSGSYTTYAAFNAAHAGQSYLQVVQNP